MKNRKYIENVLDKKFFPVVCIISITLNINLEYGYQAMGLIESSKREERVKAEKLHNLQQKAAEHRCSFFTELLAATVSVIRT